MNGRSILFASAVLLSASFARADTPPGDALSWEDCLKEAIQNHPDLVSAQAKLKQAKASKDITRSNALPQLNSSFTFSRGQSTGKSQADSYAYGVTGKQLLFDGFKTSNDIASANANIRASAYDYAVTSSNVRLRLRTAFIDLLDAQELVNVAEDIAKRRKQNLDLITLLYQNGREHQGSLLTEQANLAQAQFDVQQAQRNIELSQRRLSKELGRSEFAPIIAKGELAVEAVDNAQPDFEGLVSTVPFLKELASQKEAAKFGVRSAKADFFPQVYANADAGRSDAFWPPRSNSWSAGFSVTFPLFEGGLQQAQLSKAQAAFTQSQADERSGRDGMIFTLAQTWTNWQDSVAQVDVQKKFLDAYRTRAKIAEAEYSNGLITFNDWIIIEDGLVNNQKAFLQAKTNALIAEANWLQAKGETLDE